jgi:lipopolysaccharide biosynthesis regulator YciM
MDEAKVYLEHAIKLKPDDIMARFESGMLKSTSGDYEAAAKELEGVVRDNPNWLEPHVQLTSLYYKLHRPADGAKERAIVDRLTAEQQAKGPGK